jgi:biopolymer transport protein ExbB
MTVIELLFKGGPVMVPILACSIVSLTIVIERILFWSKQRRRISPESLLALAESNPDKMIQEAKQANYSTARVLLAGITHRDPSATEAMEAVAMEEVARMKHYLPALDTIVTLSPLLGLMGTIVGMIRSFNIISLSGLGQPHAVTGGIAEALIATAAGLGVAIATLIPYNYFLAKADGVTGEIERYATVLERILKKPASIKSPMER